RISHSRPFFAAPSPPSATPLPYTPLFRSPLAANEKTISAGHPPPGGANRDAKSGRRKNRLHYIWAASGRICEQKTPREGGIGQLDNHLRKRNLVASRFIAAIDVVSGIPFGQTCTQFCEFPHSCSPPSPKRASRRSSLFMAPVGWELNSRTWLITKGPMKLEREFTLGHASRQTPQVMHLDSS